MNLSIGNLFPIPLGRCKFDGTIPQTCVDAVRNLKKVSNAGNACSVNKFIFKKKELKPIYDFCFGAVTEYFNQTIKPKNDVSLYITQSWANYATKGNWHHTHNHSNSYISGVFYINADPKHDKITFLKDNLPNILLTSNEYTIYNSPSWWMEAETGVCYLFPSSLKHEVETIKTDGIRISISFNTFLKGNIGEPNGANYLKL